jgi:hypothetical protein
VPRKRWERLTMFLGNMSWWKYIFCCFKKGGTEMNKKIKKIKGMKEIIYNKFDIRKMIID